MDLNDINLIDNNDDNIYQDKPKRTRNILTKKISVKLFETLFNYY